MLYVALELSKETWKLGMSPSRLQKPRIRDVAARDVEGLLSEIEKAKARFGLPEAARVRTCYEAGRDGFWIHRILVAHGVDNVVIDSASIEVDRRKRRAKTDRIDAQKLVQLLARDGDGEQGVLRVVRVPPVDAEDERLLPRQIKTLKKHRTQVSNRIIARLFEFGIDLSPRAGNFKGEEFLGKLEAARQPNGEPLPARRKAMILLDWELFSTLTLQLKRLEQEQRQLLREARKDPDAATIAVRKAAILSQLCGVGNIGGLILSTEFFGWRHFENRGQVGAAAGLTGTPFLSGNGGREQGISKSGNPRVRTLMVELAWLWLRWQPNSRTTRWYHDRVGQGASLAKRKAIVAVARKLLVELWHFVEHGVVPEGAVLKSDSSMEASNEPIPA